jgi:hypothetical protein
MQPTQTTKTMAWLPNHPISLIAPDLLRKNICDDAVKNIFSFLSEAYELTKLMRVSKYFYKITTKNDLWQGIANKLLDPCRQQAPNMHYKNLIVFDHDLRKSLQEIAKRNPSGTQVEEKAKQDALEISRVAFVSLSNLEGMIELVMNKDESNRYCKLSQEMLDCFLKSDCSDDQGWGKQMEAFARMILKDLCFAEFFMAFTEEVLNCWQKSAEEKKITWIKTCSIKDVFLLPPSVVHQLAPKDQEKSENSQGLIIHFDETKCNIDFIVNNLSIVLHSDETLKVSQRIQLLYDLSQTIQFAIINDPVQRPDPGYVKCLVKFNESLKQPILDSFHEIEDSIKATALHVSRSYIDEIQWTVIELFILPELFGNPALPVNSRLVVNLPVELVKTINT